MPSFNPKIIPFLGILSIALYAGGYWLCLWLFDPSGIEFWDLRLSIMSALIGFGFWIGYYFTHGFTRAVFLVGIVFCLGDIIDRYLFNINQFQVNDILLILFALTYLPKAYAREIKTIA